jgi:murein DD-endopeptidase MepM/ murein hydrolase activator NlpD
MKKNTLFGFAIAALLNAFPAQATVTTSELGRMMLATTTATSSNIYLAPLSMAAGSFKVYASSPAGTPCVNNLAGTNYYHPGVDFPASSGTKVRSPVTGKVVAREGTSTLPTGVGALTIQKDGSTTNIVILHMSGYDVKVGDKVQAGCVVGKVGNTGTGSAHLHVEARVAKTGGACYFRNLVDGTGSSNKDPALIPPSFVNTVGTTTACIIN